MPGSLFVASTASAIKVVAAVIVSEETILPVAVISPCAVMLALALIVPVTDRALLY